MILPGLRRLPVEAALTGPIVRMALPPVGGGGGAVFTSPLPHRADLVRTDHPAPYQLFCQQ